MSIFSQLEQTLISQINAAIQAPYSERAHDWQTILGEIEAAEPLAQESGQTFGQDFKSLWTDAKNINPDNPTPSNLTQIQNDLSRLSQAPIPSPPIGDPQYKHAIANGACNVLEALLTSNPKDSFEINGILTVLAEFTASIALPYPKASDLQTLYKSYLASPSGQNLVDLEQALSNFAINLSEDL
jgi:hypothetical protein